MNLKFVISVLFVYFFAHSTKANFEDTRCRCTCPSTEYFSSKNKTPAEHYRRYYTKTNLNSANCNTQAVVKQVVLNDVDASRLDAFLANCNCRFESRNSLLLKVVVIFVICVLLGLGSYMMYLGLPYLVVVEPMLRREQPFIPYRRHGDDDDDMEENIFANPRTSGVEEASSEQQRPSELQMRSKQANQQHSGGTTLHERVLNRVASEQSKWKNSVEEQRRNVLDHSQMFSQMHRIRLASPLGLYIRWRGIHSFRRGRMMKTADAVGQTSTGSSDQAWWLRLIAPSRASPSPSTTDYEVFKQQDSIGFKESGTNSNKPVMVVRLADAPGGRLSTFLGRVGESVVIYVAKLVTLAVLFVGGCQLLLWYFGIKKVTVHTGGTSLLESLTDQPSWTTDKVDVTFEDVRGMDEAKSEVEEIVDYLRDPRRYTNLGARLPKGVLLVGAPGTGKTLLARAIAGEADCPFFHAVGSEFDEILVGQGAKRVRELFRLAKENQPCVVFIDEIDSVGSKRTNSAIHPHANQTINQLLAEMDGFEQNQGVIVIGATNRVDNLDKALLRPGRFDVQVTVSKPDLPGRKDIFRLYLDKIVHGDIHITQLAKGTTGFTGADIENLVNQAALKAAKEGAKEVNMRHLDEARDRVLMGPERIKGRLPDEEENRNTAYHEAGHAIVALFTKHADPIHKVTIIPRGSSLGHTSQLPEKDRHQTSRAQLLATLDVAMGGRVAEELTFGQENISTGASSDLRHCSQVAEQMVKVFGMSDRVGLRDFSLEPIESENGFRADRGPGTSEMIDQEIKNLLQQSYERVKDLLTRRKKEHLLLAEALMEHETLSKSDIEKLLKGEKLSKPPPPPKQQQNKGRTLAIGKKAKEEGGRG
uniref:AAA+ ATPase domain-containing protein n=1 Tax=Globodera rostochiensis TaxID=31243 RepID=A0A914I8B3_GLORO